jgi:uncharacterized protein (TIGR02145 family)
MKLRILLISFLFLALSASMAEAQKLYTAKDSILLGKDTTIRLTVPKYRGQIQWQKSINGTNWTDIKNGKKDTLHISTGTEALYRAAVADGSCLPIYSDSALLIPSDTTIKNITGPEKLNWLLISDSTQISTGQYIYVGNNTNQPFETGKVILDEQSGGTIRKVIGVIQKGDTLITTTEQATMEDLFVNTSFKLSTDMIRPESLKKAVTGTEISKALTDAEGFIHPVKIIYHTEQGSILKNAKDGGTGKFGENLKKKEDFSGTVIFKYGSSKIWISKGVIEFNPVFKFEFDFIKPDIDWENLKFNRGELKLFKFWSDETCFTVNAEVTAEIKTSLKHTGKPTALIPRIITTSFEFLLPNGIPVYISVDCDIMYKLSYDFKGYVKATTGFEANRYITAGIKYENNEWSTWNSYRKEDKFSPLDFDAKIKSSQRFEIFPHFDIKLYKVLGPWLEVIPYLTAQQNINLLKGSWDANVELGLDAQIGAEVKVMGKDILKADPYYKELFNKEVWGTPDSLGLIAGNNQQAMGGEALPSPVSVQVFDTSRQPVAGVPVFFEPDEGSLNDYKVFTDGSGMASVVWTLPVSPGKKNLTVKVLNSGEKVVRKGSLTVNATVKSAGIPVVTTKPVTDITHASAASGGEVTSDGGSTVMKAGVCWSTTSGPTVEVSNKTIDGSGSGSFTSSLTGLQGNTTYYVRAYATNSVGTAYGSQVVFTTKQNISLAVLTTKTVTEITSSSAVSGGDITTDSGAPVTARGVCWNTTGNPTILNSKTINGTETGSFASSLTDLTASTTYYVRAYATNIAGTAYGNQLTFKSASAGTPTGTFVDSRDGKTYNWVQIGNQVWMAENLAFLPSVSPPTTGSNTISYYYVYNYNGSDVNAAKSTTFFSTYGVLYNWVAALQGTVGSTSNPSDIKGICPNGWHLPSNAEWIVLENYLIINGYNYDGTTTGNKIAKSMASSINWISSSKIGAVGNIDFPAFRNKSLLSFQPGGNRASDGRYSVIGDHGYWWTSSDDTGKVGYARSKYLYYDSNDERSNSDNKVCGFSVRCVKD